MRTLIDRPTTAANAAMPSAGARAWAADWDLMFGALKLRLQQLLVAERHPGAAGDRLRASLQQCVLDLERMHAGFGHEVGRRRRLELEAFDARAARMLARRSRHDVLSVGRGPQG